MVQGSNTLTFPWLILSFSSFAFSADCGSAAMLISFNLVDFILIFNSPGLEAGLLFLFSTGGVPPVVDSLPIGSLGGLDGVVGGENNCFNLDIEDEGNRFSSLVSTFGSTTRSPVLLLKILSMTESGIFS